MEAMEIQKTLVLRIHRELNRLHPDLISDEQRAAFFGMTTKAYADLINGRKDIRIEDIAAMAYCLGMTVSLEVLPKTGLSGCTPRSPDGRTTVDDGKPPSMYDLAG